MSQFMILTFLYPYWPLVVRVKNHRASLKILCFFPNILPRIVTSSSLFFFQKFHNNVKKRDKTGNPQMINYPTPANETNQNQD